MEKGRASGTSPAAYPTSDIRSEKRRSRAAWCQHKWPDSVQVHRVSSCSPVKEGEQTQFLQSLFSERMSEVASTTK